MKPEYFLLAAVVLIAIPVALYAWMTSPTKVLAEIDALDLQPGRDVHLDWQPGHAWVLPQAA